MTETFKCPSCSAPLEYEGNTFQKCTFCGSNVIVPAEVFRHSQKSTFEQFDFSSLTGRALKIAEIQQEIERGNKINAIKMFRETFGVGLAEAKLAVEALERREGLDISNVQFRTVPLQFSDAQKSYAVKTVGRSIFFVAIMIAAITLLSIGVIFFVVFYAASSGGSDGPPIPFSSGTEAAEEIFKIGGEGTGLGKFKDNRSIAVDGQGRIYSGNYQGGRIQVFGPDGKFLTKWEMQDSKFLMDLAASRSGIVYAANTKGIFSYDGKTGKLLNKRIVNRVSALAVTFDGKIIATINKGIFVFSPALEPVTEFKDAGKTASAEFGFEQVAVDPNGVIYAADSRNGNLCKFSSQGKFLNRISTEVRSPRGIAVSNNGNLYVSDVSNIYVFDENGKKLSSFKTNQAFDLAFNSEDRLFVASRPYVVQYKINLGESE
ncbi:MAG: hypothetical protein R2681_12195 [Pyrinomonadaceae bacterium]